MLRAALRSKSLANIGKLTGATLIGQVLNLLAAPVLSRLYTPADFGKLSLFLSFIMLVSPIATWRLELSLVNLKGTREKVNLTLTAFGISLAMSVMCTVLFGGLISGSFFGYGILDWWNIPIVFITLLSFAIFSIMRYWVLQEGNFSTLSALELRKNIGRVIIQVGGGFIGPSYIGLIVGEAAGRMLGTNKLLKGRVKVFKAGFRNYDKSTFLTTIQRNSDYYKYAIVSTLINSLSITLPIPFIISVYGTQYGGYFSLVQKTLAVPIVFIGNALADVFHHKMASKGNINRNFNRTFLLLAAVGIGPTLVITFWGENLFAVLFGAEWRIAGTAASRMALWSFCSLCIIPLSRIVFVFNGQKSKLFYDLVSLLLSVSVFAAAFYLKWPFVTFITWLGFAWTVSYIVYFFVLKKIIQANTTR